MKVFATLTLLILFLFSPCSSDALTLATPSWDYNIANLVKHTDLVVLGKVTGMRLIPQEYATSITLKVESVIKGDPAVEDRLLRFTVMGRAGMKKHRGERILWGVEGSLEFRLGERLLLFMKGSQGDHRIFRPGGKIMVTDNKVYIPYTYKTNRFSDYYNEMREENVERYVELPLDLVVKVAKASIKDYDAIKEIEADVAKAVSLTPREMRRASPRTTLSVELLKRLEDQADQILEKGADGDEWAGTRQLETIEGKSLEPPITVEFDNSVDIPDPNLRAEIERELGRTSIAPITAADMESLTMLDADRADISDLTGLEAAINLTQLNLSVNNISDISALSGLTKLTRLMLSHNSLSDISGLSGLTNLTRLELGKNNLSDISAVSGLTNLAWLELWNNSISDISVVSGLTKLTLLHLGKNNISDLSPLVSNAGLERGDTVDVDENPLNAVSLNTHIPTLKSRGVEVRFDTVAVQPVDIPDPNLRAAIEAELGKPAGNTITVADMERLTTLDAGRADISDLTGLEAAINLTAPNLSINTLSDISALSKLTNLTHLSLMDNTLSDISALSGLTNLTWLDLSINTLSDISALSKLTNLTHLSLMDNSISDISALSGLTNLTHLWLHNNSISDVSALSGLTHLTLLWLRRNAISDISAVSGLAHLTNLGLNGNSISDISPLVANTGLGSGDSVDVWGNPLSAVSINTHIPTLQSRGVNVRVDTPVNIPDRNFRAKIEAELGKPAGDAITVEDMQSLRELDASHANISDLTGLEYATNLTHLSLIDNTLSDISALAGLTNLTWLNLFGNNISDLSPLAGLINLTSLDLMDNSVSDISALAGLTNLTWLNLIDNSVSDISALAGLTNLTFLDLSKNNISDISASAKLTNLTRLALYDNTLSDISALSGLTNLEGLYLGKNALSDISALSGLTNLIQLWLRGNNISDISPLVANTGLGSGDCVEVWGNPLSDESINTHIPALQSRGVTVHFE